MYIVISRLQHPKGRVCCGGHSAPDKTLSDHGCFDFEAATHDRRNATPRHPTAVYHGMTYDSQSAMALQLHVRRIFPVDILVVLAVVSRDKPPP